MDEWVAKNHKEKEVPFYVWRPLEFIMKTVLYIFQKENIILPLFCQQSKLFNFFRVKIKK
jgi:hypothetical protein